MHRFPWKWYLSNLADIPKNGLKVFSCFSCGGGSSMGYKLAGYEVIGNCEIDPTINAVYNKNLHPHFSYTSDIRDFAKMAEEHKLPEELYHLDILDGSPPCSTFSTNGKREQGWGVEKRFAEGQKLQRLDDLFFPFIATAKALQPRVVVAENVEGLILGKAKGYVKEIAEAFHDAGYRVQLFLLNAHATGVPQQRRRTFFIAEREDLPAIKLNMEFSEPAIKFGDIRGPYGIPIKKEGRLLMLIDAARPGERCLGDVHKRLFGKKSCYSYLIVYDDDICYTLTTSNGLIRGYDHMKLSNADIIAVSTFPQDYDFIRKTPAFICGMCVPPVMMAQVASRIYESFFSVIDG